MKTTIEVSDKLFNSAKALAQRDQTTMRALIEEGLRRVLRDSQVKAKTAFVLQDASVSGGEMLVTDPKAWQQMEQDHVTVRAIRPLP